MTSEQIIQDYIERKKDDFDKKVNELRQDQGTEEIKEFGYKLKRKDEVFTVTDWEHIKNFISNMAQEIFSCLPEEATERTSAKIREDYAMSYDECLSWNACRKVFLENIKKLK